MKKLLVVLFACVYISACSLSTVDGGEEGVMTKQPYLVGSGGVDSNPIVSGAVWTVWSTKVDRYNVKPVKYQERFIDLTASDNVAIDFDFYTTIQIEAGETPKLHELSGEKWYNNKVKDTLRAYVRNEARTRSSIDLRTNQNVILEVQKIVLTKLRNYVKEIDLTVGITKVNIGKVIPPAEVLAEAAQTASQKQAAKTQIQRKLTEDNRAAAEKAKALADKAYSSEFKMTTEQFLKNKKLDIMLEGIKSGKNVSLIINASDAKPMIGIKG